MSYGIAYGANQSKKKKSNDDFTTESSIPGFEPVGIGKKSSSKNQSKNIKNDSKVKKLDSKYSKKRENRKERLNRRADRLAAKKGFGAYGDGSMYNSDGTRDNTKAMAARKEAIGLMDSRRARGKQFFVNMAKAGAGSGDRNPYEVRSRKNPTSEGGLEGSTGNLDRVLGAAGREQSIEKNKTLSVDNTLEQQTALENVVQNIQEQDKSNEDSNGISTFMGGFGG